MLDKGIKDILNNKKTNNMSRVSKITEEIHKIVLEANSKMIEFRERHDITHQDVSFIQTKDGLIGFHLNIDKLIK